MNNLDELIKNYPLTGPPFKSSHDLKFHIGEWAFDPSMIMYQVGTCNGMYLVGGRPKETYFGILAVTNENPGNGHFNDVMEWFYHSCKAHKYDLVIMEIWNKRFLKHLREKRNFKYWKGKNDHLIMRYHKM